MFAAAGTTMKSWTSVRRAACAPPPITWISGSGIAAGLSPIRYRHNGIPCDAAAAWAAAMDIATAVLPPMAANSADSSAAVSAASTAC
ncbi:Uncharacterised protein [Mycobacteroides abscessus subsp. abscessus]|nr:Uncharacterised protein [Mycobacteroides abscessus subsp. abscessus]SHW23373.1 Uncharacterised protein [Mycobacteroides abscessus subsp. abscessus]SIL38027.1 Uncharacterised protein [Mycobacteroides abscessus subsp. abscessus]SKU65272.1 Uncharacterised protein [Mycobacteroides abscessus subsp. abscessus]SKV22617.1 Uncharacterised protein [Mycobacteroides abscessus subsp. abscessus]